MWRRVELRNYRSIDRVSIDLAPFTVLVGPNGSGKSNFADALVFARDVATDASTAVDKRGGIAAVRRWRPTKPTDVTVDIRAAGSQEALETDYVRHQFTIHSGREGAWSFSRELIELVVRETAVLKLVRTAQKLEIKHASPPTPSPPLKPARPGVPTPYRAGTLGPPNRGNFAAPELSENASAMVLARQFSSLARNTALRNMRRIRLNPDAMRQPQAATESTRLDESGSNIAVAYRSLKSTVQDSVVEAMRKIIPGLSRISVEPFDRFLLLKFDQHQAGDQLASFSAAEMSEGALRALGILVAAQQMTKDELLIIEEPEVSIHVGAAQLLFDVLEKASRKGAVLITTHSADLLDAASDEAIQVCSYRGGVTRIGPLSSAQRDVVKEGLFSVAELMRSEPLRIEGEAPEAVAD
jgi:type I restriction enzyme M protein